jgi:hypothetical protein
MIHQFHHKEDASQHHCADINPIGIKSLVGPQSGNEMAVILSLGK